MAADRPSKLASESNTTPGEVVADVPVSFIDEGNGIFRFYLDDDLYFGIYRQEGDRFIACFSDKHRPIEFKLTERRGLFTLHRVKPGK